MKELYVTRLTGNGKLPKQISLEMLIREMKSDLYREKVFKFREESAYKNLEGSSPERGIPQVVYSSLLKQKSKNIYREHYTGVVPLCIDHLSSPQEAIEIRRKASQSLQTLASFIGHSGDYVCILVHFTLPDGTLPSDPQKIDLFHAHACHRLRAFYGSQLNRFIDLEEASPGQYHRITYDPYLYYNPQAVSIRMEQPLRPVDQPGFRERMQMESDPFKRMIPGYERSRILSLLYETSFRRATEQTGGIRATEPKTFLVALAENCFRSGIPEEDVIKYTMVRSPFAVMEPEIRLTIRNVYESEKGFGAKPCISKEILLNFRLKEFMERRYQFRFNQLKNSLEYHVYRSYYFHFVPVTRRERNGICLDAQGEGIPVWDKDIVRYLESNRIPIYNPLEDYLENLPAWDGKDRIRLLADRIATRNREWTEQFYKWFLYMVAQWTFHDEIHANSTVPVLIGKQGYHKSTFCKMLLPPELRDYYKEHLDLSKRREAEQSLTRYALINLDEFDSISPNHHSFLKHLLQKTEVNEPVSRSQPAQRLKRYASFIATCNRYDLLTDPTGSRRFICLELTDDFKPDEWIEYDQLYAQAKEALKKDEKYWFTKDEESRIIENNEAFQQLSVEGELFRIWFRPPTPGEKGEWVTGMELLLRMKNLSRVNLSITRRMVNRFCAELIQLGVEKKHTKKGNVYHVLQIKT